MIIELIIALIIGVMAGTFTGLFPGIHINLVATLLISSSLISLVSPLTAVIFIVAMSITHTFLDFIPSIYLGAPQEDSFLSILPGHQLLKEGRGHEAVVLTLYGSIFALPVILIFTPIFVFILPMIYGLVALIMPFILIFISLFLIFREENIFSSFLVFALSGLLGLLTFNLPIKEPLMPLLTGLFGVSALFISIKNKSGMEKQKELSLKEIKLTKNEFGKACSAAIISSPFCSFLPGIGSGHAAVIGSELIEQNNKSFLFLVGSLNTIVMGLSFVTAYVIQKTRTGSATIIQEILTKITFQNLMVILLIIILSSLFAFFIGLYISKKASTVLNKISYRLLSIVTLVVLISLTLIFSNFLGLTVLITGASIGAFCILSNSRRINLMGCLLIPTIIYYLF
ncbi:tripartite tricarboxylate transporter permease [Candidatus Pacearchaeota archaeon]|nr:tripartite tricarboxylate transporter permease [Candidatus Pacearchaeota archaeon]